MIAFSSTSSGTVTSQPQYLSSSSGGLRPRPIFWASSYLESSPFFLLLFTPTFLKSLEPHFRLLILILMSYLLVTAILHKIMQQLTNILFLFCEICGECRKNIQFVTCLLFKRRLLQEHLQ